MICPSSIARAGELLGLCGKLGSGLMGVMLAAWWTGVRGDAAA